MPTITFSEYALGTTNPTFNFSDTVVRTTGVIVGDGAQPNSPVIAANSSYRGPVFIYFDTAVTRVSLAVGYFDNIGSTRIEFRDASGRLVQSFENTALGVLTYSSQHAEGIASISIIDQAIDNAGFSVDTIAFGPAVEDLPPPLVDLVTAGPAIDRAFGRVEGGSTLSFSGAVGDNDGGDFISLSVSEATQARVRIFLSDDPNNARDLTFNLTAGTNILRIRPDQSYGDLEQYAMVVKVADFADPDQQFIDDMLADILGSIFSYKEAQNEIFAHIMRNVGNADEAAALLGKMSKAFGYLGYALDFANRIDNVQSASNWRKQLAIEIGDFALGLGVSGGATFGVSLVGTPIAGVLAGFVTGVVYTYGVSNYVRTELGEAFDAYVGGLRLTVEGADIGDAVSAPGLAAAAAPDFSRLVFDEDWYVANNPAAAAAVASGAAVSGFAYYLSTGIRLGHQINPAGTVVGAAQLAAGVKIVDPGDLVDPYLGTRAPGARAGDLLTQGEVAFVDYVNNDIRTEGTELALNAGLSALANRIALDAVLNRGEMIEEVILEGGRGWAATLSNGENYRSFLADLASDAGIDMSQTAVFASWNGGTTPDAVYASLVTGINAARQLVGLDSQAIGVAQVGGLWIVLVSTQGLQADAEATDRSVLRQTGTASGNDLLGGEGRDLMAGMAGDDRLWGHGDNDSLTGGTGRDTLNGGDGSDRLEGGDADDTLIGDGFAARPPTGPGDVLIDITTGGTGRQVIAGSVVNQTDAPVAINRAWSLAADPDIANATENAHITLDITASGERFESFSFTARAGQTFVFDVDGVFNAGTSIDSYLELRDAAGTIIGQDDDSSTTDGGGGSTSSRDPYLSHLFTVDGTYTISLRPYSSVNFVAGTTARLAISVDILRNTPPSEANPNADVLIGGGGHDRMLGEAGNDRLYGENGNDSLIGGLGADSMLGGAGNDVYVVNSARDQVFETTTVASSVDAGGVDVVRSEVSFSLAANPGARFVERLTLMGTGNLNGTGNDLANLLTGNAGRNSLAGGSGNDTLFGDRGNDTLNGGLGADTMLGGAGNDVYLVNSARDRVLETRSLVSAIDAGGVDAVQSAVSFSLGASTGLRFVERLTLVGTANLNGNGNALANILNGNTGNNTLNGGLGNDSLNGGAGNDTLLGGLGDDRLNGGTGRDRLSGGEGADHFVFASRADSAAGPTRDIITDFSSAMDVIDVSGFAPRMSFIGAAGFSGTAGQIRYSATDGIVAIDLNGDRVADFSVMLQGTPELSQGNFLL